MLFWFGMILLLAGVSPARGQAEMRLTVMPAQANLVLGRPDEVTLELYLTNAVEINAYYVSITYDPVIVTFTGWVQGDFLATPSCFYQVDQPGFFELACTQLASPGVNGGGKLLSLVFEGVSPGTSPITISKAELSNITSETLYPQRQHGSLTAAYDPALLDQFPLTGSVGLQGQVNRNGVPVGLAIGETYQIGPYTAVTTDQAGANLNFGLVVGDTYTITTAQPRYLNLTPELGKRFTLTATETALAPLRLLAGNARWTDNVIDVGDLSLVGFWFGKTLDDLAPGETLAGDLNFDGVVDLRDLALVCGNYGLTSAAAYDEWSP